MVRRVVVVVAIALLMGACSDDEAAENGEPDEETTTEETTTETTETAETAEGTITISIEEWSGVEGYQLLGVVWDQGETAGSKVVGGVFGGIVGSDPFSVADVVHPAFDGQKLSDEDKSWIEGDYLWDETAVLDPGRYRVEMFANPQELAPYGSHIPALPIERQCSVEVEVVDGEAAIVALAGIPVYDDTDVACPTTP